MSKCSCGGPWECRCDKLLITKDNMHNKWQTREGDRIRIISVDRINDEGRPIVALHGANGVEIVTVYYSSGRLYPSGLSPLDIIPVKEKKKGWINIYKSRTGGGPSTTSHRVHSSQEQADKHTSKDRVACIPIEWEE